MSDTEDEAILAAIDDFVEKLDAASAVRQVAERRADRTGTDQGDSAIALALALCSIGGQLDGLGRLLVAVAKAGGL